MTSDCRSSAVGAVAAPPAAAAGSRVSTRPTWLMVMPLRAAEQHVLVVLGEADLSTADQLRGELIGALGVRPPALLVELGALQFCDLSGLDALHDAARAAAYAGVSMTFRGMSPMLEWLDRTFPPTKSAPARPPVRLALRNVAAG